MSFYAGVPPLIGSCPQVVFEKGSVYLHTSAKKHQDPDSLIAGVIRVVEKVGWDGTGQGQAQSGVEVASLGVWSGCLLWDLRKTVRLEREAELCQAEGPKWGRSWVIWFGELRREPF